MKAVILAGGHGTRISEESAVRPKPMIDIGGRPILWHIMKIYSAHGINDFVVCCGYQGHVIREYFANYRLNQSDVTVDLAADTMVVHRSAVEPWRVTLVDTGERTMTGGRLRRVRDYVAGETFCLTYGDGVTDVNIDDLVAFHRSQRTYLTLTAVQPPGRFGAFSLDAGRDARPRLQGEAERRWRLGERWLLRLRAAGVRLHRVGRHGLGERADGAAVARANTSRRSAMMASGSRWTRCATGPCSRSCGNPGRRGRSGDA